MIGWGQRRERERERKSERVRERNIDTKVTSDVSVRYRAVAVWFTICWTSAVVIITGSWYR